NLCNADLRGVDFARANLKNAKLDHACMVGADFTGADLENVSNSDTDFSHAIMNGVAEMQSNATSSIMYSRSEKYREDTIAEICTLIKSSYQRDQSKSRNAKSDGLFRTTSHVEELKFASQAFKDKSLDLKKTPLSCLTKIINNEFAKLLALRAEVAEEMVNKPEEAKKILRQETKRMHPIEKKSFSMLLELYSDA
ncbi:pentapeptide repeat-containing protein, partial [Candidatus Symbiopectobacterium sp. NZEC127]|nr:pentapeptide repeat-containing protein [Candidatus Symbiopectobacterium sp. NZEC127]